MKARASSHDVEDGHAADNEDCQDVRVNFYTKHVANAGNELLYRHAQGRADAAHECEDANAVDDLAQRAVCFFT